MNTSYENLIVQINELTKQAEIVRAEEVKKVIESIKEQIKQHGINPVVFMEDPTLFETSLAQKVIHTRRKPDAKYKDPVSGAIWTGRGKIPKWMKPALENGTPKEHFLI